MNRHTFKSLATVASAACLTVLSLDMVLGHLSPVVHRREVQEGIEDLQRIDPEILVLGSSHGRTFHVLGQELERQSHGRHTLVAVPLENGKLSSYAWLLDNRISPFYDGSSDAAERKRSKLKRFVILTEWWDSCRDKSAGWNLPSRAWTFHDFWLDVISNGLNSYNRNYIQSKWRRVFWNSPLVQDRGFEVLTRNVVARLRHQSTKLSPSVYAERVKTWQTMVENGTNCLGNPTEMAALERLVRFGVDRRLDTSIVLFPRKPDTITKKAKQTTLEEFRTKVVGLVAPMGVRVVDLTTSSPLRSDEFMDDFDHVNADGNQKFAKWALAGPLSFLSEASVASDSTGPQ